MIIYVKEAHPISGWHIETNVCYRDPKTTQDRIAIAKEMIKNLGIQSEFYVDPIDNNCNYSYSAWPERVYIIDEDLKIQHMTAPGPFGYDLDGVRKFLQRYPPPK